MEYTTLGSTGTKVSQLCFGTWRFGKESNGVLESDREEAYELAAWDEQGSHRTWDGAVDAHREALVGAGRWPSEPADPGQ